MPISPRVDTPQLSVIPPSDETGGWGDRDVTDVPTVRMTLNRMARGGHHPAMITQSRSLFSMTCCVTLDIRASAARIWSVLTDADGFPRWNSTVTKLEGQIREGERLRVHVPGTSRTFTPRVSGVVPEHRMTWTGGFSPLFKGVRTFELKPGHDGSTAFAMEERFSGLMLPLVKGSMPDFGPVFERYANDLKREAELDEPVRSHA
jgi:hypothetical protein